MPTRSIQGKRFVGLVMSERQAKILVMYLDTLVAHGASRPAARSLRLVKIKLERSLSKIKPSDAASNADQKEK